MLIGREPVEEGYAILLEHISDRPGRIMSQGDRFSQRVLDAGFAMALVLAAVSLGAGIWYLTTFLTATQEGVAATLVPSAQFDFETRELAIHARLVMARVALQSCGIFVGMSFGFLGFALFLIGVKGELDVDAKSENYTVKVARMAPGVFVILISAVLVGICVTRATPFQSRPVLVQHVPEVDRTGTEKPPIPPKEFPKLELPLSK